MGESLSESPYSKLSDTLANINSINPAALRDLDEEALKKDFHTRLTTQEKEKYPLLNFILNLPETPPHAVKTICALYEFCKTIIDNHSNEFLQRKIDLTYIRIILLRTLHSMLDIVRNSQAQNPSIPTFIIIFINNSPKAAEEICLAATRDMKIEILMKNVNQSVNKTSLPIF